MKKSQRGKKPNQKLKPYAVLQYLLKNSDENHFVSATEIKGFLLECCGMYADRRSIYKDIEEINRIALALDEDCTLDEADEMLSEDDSDELKLVKYDSSKKGFYIDPYRRKYDLNDIRLLAECVYSAKFIAESQAQRLVNVVSSFVSDHEAEKIQHDAFLTDRVKTNNKNVLNYISTLNDAMSKSIGGVKHVPEKVTFKYLKYSIHDLSNQVERRQGETYKVSPYRLLINDGNYYLLAFDDKSQKMRTYRVDRMKNVSPTKEPRDGEEVFRSIDILTYAQRTFSMYEGKQEHVTLQFIMPLLDTVIDRFGTSRDVQYFQKGDQYFTVTTDVKISDQFFGWILGFGRRAAILSPNHVVEQFTAYIEKISEMYKEYADG